MRGRRPLFLLLALRTCLLLVCASLVLTAFTLPTRLMLFLRLRQATIGRWPPSRSRRQAHGYVRRARCAAGRRGRENSYPNDFSSSNFFLLSAIPSLLILTERRFLVLTDWHPEITWRREPPQGGHSPLRCGVRACGMRVDAAEKMRHL